MTLTGFVLAVLALLLAPGPTNTLMAVAGAQGGLGRVLRLLPAELAGYSISILLLAFLGASLLAAFPALESGLKVAAALWIGLLAVKLWTPAPQDGTAQGVTARQVFVTTLLNPKALVFSLVLLPSPHAAAFVPRFALFLAMVVGVAVLWGALGVMTRATGPGARRIHILQRAASVWLVLVALSLVVDVLRA